jgi:hypothetical protein
LFSNVHSAILSSKLKVGIAKKISLYVLFAASVFCTVVSVMRMAMSISHPGSVSPVLLWSTVEEAVASVVPNRPTLRVCCSVDKTLPMLPEHLGTLQLVTWGVLLFMTAMSYTAAES